MLKTGTVGFSERTNERSFARRDELFKWLILVRGVDLAPGGIPPQLVCPHSALLLRCLRQPPQKIARREDGDVLNGADRAELSVAGNEIGRFAGEGSGEDEIVLRVRGYTRDLHGQ
jgi:hypothetical protein